MQRVQFYMGNGESLRELTCQGCLAGAGCTDYNDALEANGSMWLAWFRDVNGCLVFSMHTLGIVSHGKLLRAQCSTAVVEEQRDDSTQKMCPNVED